MSKPFLHAAPGAAIPMGYSRYRERLRDRTVVGQKFAEAQVNCCFYGQESRWGVIESSTACILYFGVALSQDASYSFDFITIHMKFKAEESAPDSQPTVMKFIAPQELWGPERKEKIVQTRIVAPTLNISGIANVGQVNCTKAYERTQRWLLRGRRLPDETRPDETRTDLYPIVQWSLASTPHVIHGPPGQLYLAVTVQHASTPFLVEVGVDDGKLRCHGSGPMRGIIRSQHDKGVARIVPHPDQMSLLEEASNLEREIEKKTLNGAPNSNPQNPGGERPPEPNTSYLFRNIVVPLNKFVGWVRGLFWRGG